MIKIYRDLDDFGESFTIYKDGKFVDSVLFDDEQLKAIPNWEDYVVDGLDNRTRRTA